MRVLVLAVALFLLSTAASAASETAERTAIIDRVATLFLKRDFGALEQAASEFRAANARTASGIWKLTLFYAGLDKVSRVDASNDILWTAIDETSAEWLRQYPESPTAINARARIHMQHAWEYRGRGFAKVPPQNWPLFEEQMLKAWETLERNKQIGRRDPHWYALMLEVATIDKLEPGQFHELVQEATAQYPHYYPIYFEALTYYLPKWHGDIYQLDDFIRYAVKRTQEKEGRSLYARLYWYASQVQFGQNIFRRSEAKWKQMAASFRDVLARHPDQWNINSFARFACVAMDQKTTRELMGRIEGDGIPEAWGSLRETEFSGCKAWAVDGKPYPAHLPQPDDDDQSEPDEQSPMI